MLSKKVVITLAIVALVLAFVSITLNMFESGKEVPTPESKGSLQSSSSGKIGIEILPPTAEDKGEQ